MKTLTTLAMTVVFAVVTACAWAQHDEPRVSKLSTAWGKVVSLDKEAKTLTALVSTKRGEEPKETVFALTDETKVILAGEGRETKAGTLDDVKADARVVIVYKAGEGDAKPTALSIRVSPAATTK